MEKVVTDLPSGVREMVFAFLPIRPFFSALLGHRSFRVFVDLIRDSGLCFTDSRAIASFWDFNQTEIEACLIPRFSEIYCLEPGARAGKVAEALAGLRQIGLCFLAKKKMLESQIKRVRETQRETLIFTPQLFSRAFTATGLLAQMSYVTEINLSETQVEDLRPLSSIFSLRVLRLMNTRVKDLTPISGCSELKALDLNGTRVVDLSPLEGLVDLGELLLEDTPVSQLTPLARLGNLRMLALPRTLVEDLRPLAGLRNLGGLDLSGTKVKDLRPLSRLGNLTGLLLSGTTVVDLSPLSGLNALKVLYLADTRVEDLRPLSFLPMLEILDLRQANLARVEGIANLVARGLQIDR